MKNYNKKQFLKEVTQEIENIKKHATKKEKENLDFYSFDPDHINYCIYGQLTGDCQSDRAIELIKKCCKRYFYFKEKNSFSSTDYFTFTNVKKDINGIKVSDDFVVEDSDARNFEYQSLLEGFIKLKNANNENILSYIKGETDKLVLEKKQLFYFLQ